MFGLSLGKILITILIIVAIWKGFALVTRLASERKAALRRQSGAAGRAKGSHAQRARTVELRECPRCGAYVDPREGCRCGLRSNEARRTGS